MLANDSLEAKYKAELESLTDELKIKESTLVNIEAKHRHDYEVFTNQNEKIDK